MKIILALSILFLALPPQSPAGVKEALDAQKRGDYETARKEFEALAKKGSDDAMIELGLMYHTGKGMKQDYAKAMDWYLKAFKKGNGDAYNNIGVLYRDGLGVQTNRAIAYALFYIIHMRGLGTEETQMRAGRNLTRLIDAMKPGDILPILEWPEKYVLRFVETRGKLTDKEKALKQSKTRPTLKDLANL